MMHHRQDDRIVLPGLAPHHIVTESVVYRPRLGEDVTLHCQVPGSVGWHHVSWLHQDWTVFAAGQPQPLPVMDTTGQSYRFDRVNNTLIFVVLNATMRSGGVVECVIDPAVDQIYTTRRRVLRRFLLLPLITHRGDVFAASDTPYLTATEGERFVVQCSIRLPIPIGILENLRNHVMWVHHGRVVQGPWEKPYGSAREIPDPDDNEMMPSTGNPPRVKSGHSEFINSPGQLVHAELYFTAVTLANEGFIQCLFRPHQDIHEWIVQSMTLLVFPKNSTQ
ncbi:uncharacterized protein LOC129588945 [Paramacrobiotus metropolitanus]|uniref:uncharacterized protein LOC129588945 n=1 Tax=Paramacrobiotus metropolitanus TaxID=2943436 RepID=UPI0024456E62|nr:uncharacterized protein LOC129588945 [Paramacrobiotus metropolitanus]XP_055339344.1 uncharacterized protein LOC129588945 [Paramacrobiotus metropolitanus]XP_055339345.1 uncharacterized protein LOC129588945 [Paramacrobiotus metropolitanus]XP_055339346.1 uncharacterized protein LOC129588945 [Paramacrobiotus metropolitanus]XP_055339347.1 uncharacterized protein LOC129588945 [Paramacrobiotus metropolitanus]XP_055339348.1 uncharacterized protein LOC129588945 [Paramacrobiotus metropolitanus]XP_05